MSVQEYYGINAKGQFLVPEIDPTSTDFTNPVPSQKRRLGQTPDGKLWIQVGNKWELLNSDASLVASLMDSTENQRTFLKQFFKSGFNCELGQPIEAHVLDHNNWVTFPSSSKYKNLIALRFRDQSFMNIDGTMFVVGPENKAVFVDEYNPSIDLADVTTYPQDYDIVVDLGPAPTTATTANTLVFFEKFDMLITSATVKLFPYGNLNYNGPSFGGTSSDISHDDYDFIPEGKVVKGVDSLLHPAVQGTIGITSTGALFQRVWRLRVVKNVGVNHEALRYDCLVNALTPIYAQGVLSAQSTASFSNTYPETGITFHPMGLGHFYATQDFSGAVIDNTVVAVPGCLVSRRNSAAWTSTNYNGTARMDQLSTGGVDSGISGRMDGLFYDVIHFSDITDLRHEAMSDSDLQRRHDKTLLQLAKGELRTVSENLKFKTETGIWRTQHLQADGLKSSSFPSNFAATWVKTGGNNAPIRPDSIRNVWGGSSSKQELNYVIPDIDKDGVVLTDMASYDSDSHTLILDATDMASGGANLVSKSTLGLNEYTLQWANGQPVNITWNYTGAVGQSTLTGVIESGDSAGKVGYSNTTTPTIIGKHTIHHPSGSNILAYAPVLDEVKGIKFYWGDVEVTNAVTDAMGLRLGKQNFQKQNFTVSAAYGRKPFTEFADYQIGLYGSCLVRLAEDEYRLYFSGKNATDSSYKIYVATAHHPAGPWTVVTTPVLADDYGTDGNVFPSVVKVAGTYYMVFSGKEGDTQKVYSATSTTGLLFNIMNNGDPIIDVRPPFDDFAGEPCVIWRDNVQKFQVYFTGKLAGKADIYTATGSALNALVVNATPVIDTTESISAPCCFYDGTHYKMFFRMLDGAEVGYAFGANENHLLESDSIIEKDDKAGYIDSSINYCHVFKVEGVYYMLLGGSGTKYTSNLGFGLLLTSDNGDVAGSEHRYHTSYSAPVSLAMNEKDSIVFYYVRNAVQSVHDRYFKAGTLDLEILFEGKAVLSTLGTGHDLSNADFLERTYFLYSNLAKSVYPNAYSSLLKAATITVPGPNYKSSKNSSFKYVDSIVAASTPAGNSSYEHGYLGLVGRQVSLKGFVGQNLQPYQLVNVESDITIFGAGLQLPQIITNPPLEAGENEILLLKTGICSVGPEILLCHAAKISSSEDAQLYSTGSLVHLVGRPLISSI